MFPVVRDDDRIIEDLPAGTAGTLASSAIRSVIHEGEAIAAYLFGYISKTAPTGHVHAIAVSVQPRRRHLARKLFWSFLIMQRGVGF